MLYLAVSSRNNSNIFKEHRGAVYWQSIFNHFCWTHEKAL